MDECAYFYCATTSTMLAAADQAGRKSSKKRDTVAIARNADGSIRPPLPFIGVAQQPRCFGGSSAAELGVYYTASRRDWMTSAIFERWVRAFNSDMEREGRKVLLILDNVASHKHDIELSNVKIAMIPPNTTTHLQPQDAGVIRTFKTKISALQNKHVVDNLDALLERAASHGAASIEDELQHLHDTDVLTAMLWAQQAWSYTSSTVMRNCWKRTQVLNEELFELVSNLSRLRIEPPTIRNLTQ